MKLIPVLMAICLLACNESVQNAKPAKSSDSAKQTTEPSQKVEDKKPVDPAPTGKSYSNKRFKHVTVKKLGDNKYTIEGKGQIFEANFNWVVEDGHEEIKKGFQMTDAGAPEWGNFKFTIEVAKKRPNSTLTLILFETSAKDGSRQHELPIVLE